MSQHLLQLKIFTLSQLQNIMLDVNYLKIFDVTKTKQLYWFELVQTIISFPENFNNCNKKKSEPQFDRWYYYWRRFCTLKPFMQEKMRQEAKKTKTEKWETEFS